MKLNLVVQEAGNDDVAVNVLNNRIEHLHKSHARHFHWYSVEIE